MEHGQLPIANGFQSAIGNAQSAIYWCLFVVEKNVLFHLSYEEVMESDQGGFEAMACLWP